MVKPPPLEPTPSGEPAKPDPKKLDAAAAITTVLKHCLAMDGSLNQQPRLIDAYDNQPDLEHLPKDLSGTEKEKVQLYTMGRPDIPDFGFLISDIWRVTPRNSRIKFDAIISLKLASALGFKYGSYAFDANCKPVLQGDITSAGGFEHASITMPLAFGDRDVQLTYLMVKQNGYNWQIDDLLIDNAGVANYVQKDLAPLVKSNGVEKTTQGLCQSLDNKALLCR